MTYLYVNKLLFQFMSTTNVELACYINVVLNSSLVIIYSFFVLTCNKNGHSKSTRKSFNYLYLIIFHVVNMFLLCEKTIIICKELSTDTNLFVLILNSLHAGK